MVKIRKPSSVKSVFLTIKIMQTWTKYNCFVNLININLFNVKIILILRSMLIVMFEQCNYTTVIIMPLDSYLIIVSSYLIVVII